MKKNKKVKDLHSVGSKKKRKYCLCRPTYSFAIALRVFLCACSVL